MQIAKAERAEVTGVCSTANTELVRSLGADHIVDYTRTDWAFDAHRYDVVLDIGGNTKLSRLRRGLTPGGTLVIVGGERAGRLIGGIHRQLAAQLLSPVVAERLGTLIASERADILCCLNELVEMGTVKPVLGRCLPLSDAVHAVTDLDARRTQGRLALTP